MPGSIGANVLSPSGEGTAHFHDPSLASYAQDRPLFATVSPFSYGVTFDG